MRARIARDLRTVGALSYYIGILPMIRIPTLLPFVFSTPFTILFILFVTGRGQTIIYGIAGAVTMTVSQQGLFLGADLTNLRIEHKFQSVVVASPVSPLTYMLSVATSELAFAAPALVILMVILPYFTSGVIRDPSPDHHGHNSHLDYDQFDRVLPVNIRLEHAHRIPDGRLHLNRALGSAARLLPITDNSGTAPVVGRDRTDNALISPDSKRDRHTDAARSNHLKLAGTTRILVGIPSPSTLQSQMDRDLTQG